MWFSFLGTFSFSLLSIASTSVSTLTYLQNKTKKRSAAWQKPVIEKEKKREDMNSSSHQSFLLPVFSCLKWVHAGLYKDFNLSSSHHYYSFHIYLTCNFGWTKRETKRGEPFYFLSGSLYPFLYFKTHWPVILTQSLYSYNMSHRDRSFCHRSG